MARDRLATLVDDLENSHGADLGETSLATGTGRALDRCGTPQAVGHRPPSSWIASGPAASPEFFSTFARFGVVTAPDDRHGAGRPLPRTSRGADSLPGQARIRDAARGDSPIARIAGGRLDGRAGAHPAAVDRPGRLGACQPDGPSARSSPISTAWGASRTPASTRQGDLADGPAHRSDPLARPAADRALSGGDVDRRLGLPIKSPGDRAAERGDREPRPRSRPRPRLRPESAPAASAASDADARVARAGTRTGRPRCGSTSNCSTG